MPKRIVTRKFKTPEAQGSGSYITFRIPMWEEIKSAVIEFSNAGKEYREFLDKPRSDDKTEEVVDTLTNVLWQKAAEKFVEWNWVDEEGEPLAGLSELTPGDLYGPELDCIVKNVQALYQVSRDEEGNPNG